MTVVIVDDEALIRKMMTEAVREALPAADLHVFAGADEVLDFAGTHPIQIAFLDIRLIGISGTELARQLQAIQPQMNIIFCTAFDEYKSNAMDLHASGYLMKPVQAEDILKELKMLRYPLTESSEKKDDKLLHAVCFGDFHATCHGKPIPFLYQKTLELLALLIDRNGALCTNKYVLESLWDDGESHVSYLKRIRGDLKSTFTSIGIQDVLFSQHGMLGIDPSAVECDYYDFLAGGQKAINDYEGSYMAQYSWAEETNARLFWKKQEYLDGIHAAEQASE